MPLTRSGTQYPDASLCIVGRIGWLCEELVSRIVRHPQYNRSLFMFNDLSDAELEYCYQHAKGLIFPSHAEGFGLPVVEALQHGLHVLVSDIPIHREVGREFCTYFDPQSPAALARLVCGVEATGEFPRVRRAGRFRAAQLGREHARVSRQVPDRLPPRGDIRPHRRGRPPDAGLGHHRGWPVAASTPVHNMSSRSSVLRWPTTMRIGMCTK